MWGIRRMHSTGKNAVSSAIKRKEVRIMQSVYDIKKQICEVGKQIFDKGYCAANDGNISVKVGDNEFYCTPTGVSKGNMTPDMIIKIDANGNKIDGKLNPSSEIKMHMRVYREHFIISCGR